MKFRRTTFAPNLAVCPVRGSRALPQPRSAWKCRIAIPALGCWATLRAGPDFSQKVAIQLPQFISRVGLPKSTSEKKIDVLLVGFLSASTEPRVRRGRVRRAASSRVGPERQSAVVFVPVSGAVSARRDCGVLPPMHRARVVAAPAGWTRRLRSATVRTAVSPVWSLSWVFPPNASPSGS